MLFRSILWWDFEIKLDHDEEEKFFIYLYTKSQYIAGTPTPGEGIERLEWVSKDKLEQYDQVPPSVKFFKRLGYL